MKILKIFLLLMLSSSSFFGCTKIFNPYESEFMCPDVPKGKCATMQQAYSESFTSEDIKNEMVLEKPPCIDCGEKNTAYSDGNEVISENAEAEQKYKAQVYNKIASNITEEKPPMIQTPRTMRMLVVNYQDGEEVLYGSRFVYFMSGKNSWIMDSIN